MTLGWLGRGAWAAVTVWFGSLTAMRSDPRRPTLHAPQPRADSVAVAEAAYARAVVTLADGAIRQLDVLPARAQLRVQMAFLDPRASAGVPFGALAKRGESAADAAEAAAERFGALTPPGDLAPLHASLVSSLRDAQAALARVVAVAAACRGNETSLDRCQAPFSDAAGALSRAYERYAAARRRVREQIVDTGTNLPELSTPRTADAKRP